jgi:Bifunctional DNA primase/polymerase, N-terminal
MTPLSIPDIGDDTDTLTAALAYAKAGWYILPTKAGTKDPGSIVGKGWPAKSSRDPKQITAWFAGTDHGIALHAGRSGAVIIDVDEPDNVPDEVLLIMNSDTPYQSTRPNQPGRGHYLLLNDTGRRIGNSLGHLATQHKWGEMRGANGVIVAAPTKHPDKDGQYRWQRTGLVPAIPDYLAEALPESATPEDTATDTEIEHFLNSHTESTKPEALTGLVNTLTKKLADRHSCHMSTLGILTDAMQEAAAGYYDARTATRNLYPPYLATITTGTSTGRVLTKSEARKQYAGIIAWAIGQAEPNTGKARDRVATKYQESVIEIDPAEITDAPPAAALETIEADFWTARDSLKLIYEAALSQMCAPWAVLACCAARTLTLIPPTVTLPPIIGGPGSLNWYAAIVAKSGGGKGAANAVAGRLVPQEILIRGAGSGEGMLEAYERRKEPQDHVLAILFSVDEVDSLTSLKARSGQTTMSVLRSGFSGEALGYSYRGRSTEKVDAHSYRMTMIVSVQPERAEGLFSDAGGGTPQRFMWFPGRDRRIRAKAPTWPVDAETGYGETLPLIDFKKLSHGHLGVPAEAERLIRQAREDSMRGDDEALDGHALFCREKFAYALALFDGRTTINREDWRLSGVAADVSDWCRQRAQTVLERSREAEAAERGRWRGIEHYESEISKAVIWHEELRRILTWAVKKLQAADGRMAKRSLTISASSRDRAKLTEAMLRGVESGLIKADGADWVLL